MRSDDYVDLSVGRYYFRVLTHRMRVKAEKRSTIIRDVKNTALFFDVLEWELLIMRRRLHRKLSVSDGNKVREAMKKILLRHGVIEEEVVVKNKNNSFSPEEEAFFLDSQNKQKQLAANNFNNLPRGNR